MFAAQLAEPELGDIDLPPAFNPGVDQANLRLVAPLYLASELEAARVLPATEILAGLFVSGGLQSDLGAAAESLARFWRARRERLTSEERHAIFAQLFGRLDGPPIAADGGSNVAFEELFLNLVEALVAVDHLPPQSPGFIAGVQARLRTAALAVAANLAPRSHGTPGFAARDLLETLQQALDILKQPAVQHAVQARSTWHAVQILAQRYLGEEPAIDAYVTRGRAGQTLLAWVAGHLPQLDSPARHLAAAGDPVVTAAQAWLQASLDLIQSAPPTPRST